MMFIVRFSFLFFSFLGSSNSVYMCVDWMMHWLGNQAIWGVYVCLIDFNSLLMVIPHIMLETSREICINSAHSLQNNNFFGNDSTAGNYSNRQLKYYPVYGMSNPWFSLHTVVLYILK